MNSLLSGTNRQKPFVAISLLLVLSTVAVYWPVTGYDFVNLDDNVHLYENPNLSGGLTREGIRWAVSADLFSDSPNADFWAPATFLSHLITAEFFGLDPSGHHLTNVVLHAINVFLLFFVLVRMTGDIGPSAFVAAVFAVHPIHVESVAWVTERKDVLSGMFFMLTLWAYIRYTEHPGAKRYGLVALAFALGLMSKPMLVTVPFVLLLLDVWPLGRMPWGRPTASAPAASPLRLLFEKAPLAALSIVSAAITFFGVRREGALVPHDDISFGYQAANAAVSYVAYIGKFFWPNPLAVLYPHPGELLSVGTAAGAALLVLLISAGVLFISRTRRYFFTGWFWYLGTLVPVIGLLQAGSQAMADRYTYIPSIGLSAALAWGIWEPLRERPGWGRMLGAGSVLVIVILTALTGLQIRHWKDSVSLFEHAVAVTRNNSLAHYNLGVAYKDRRQWDRAEEHLRTAAALRPNHVGSHNNLGLVLRELGRTEEAVREYRTALSIRPDDAGARNNLAEALADQGRWEEATAEFEAAFRLGQNPAIAYNLGMIYLQTGRRREARGAFEAAVRLDPTFREAEQALGHLPP